ncbi:hypothetical protein [Nostoc sp.]|uniref:hypothetical protein n=1 Tax=Nostoc sp. TaxID=1180 RepID=UPI002FF89B54
MFNDLYLSESEESECQNILELLRNNSQNNDTDYLLWRLKYEIFADGVKKSWKFSSFDRICALLHESKVLPAPSTCHERAWAYEEKRIITEEMQIDISQVKNLSVHTLLELRKTKDVETKRQILSMALDNRRNNYLTAEDIQNARKLVTQELEEIKDFQPKSVNQTTPTESRQTRYLYIDNMPLNDEWGISPDLLQTPSGREAIKFTVFNGRTTPDGIAAPQESAIHNQGIPFNLNSQIYVWEGLRFRSKAEIAIAYTLDRFSAFYMPNCLGRLNDSQKPKGRGNKEADFLVCYQGKWGILEVDGPHHTAERRVEEQERERLFRLHGIRVVERYDSEKCKTQPFEVVKQFLQLLRL